MSSGNTIQTISKTLPNFVHLSNQRSSGQREKKLGLKLAESSLGRISSETLDLLLLYSQLLYLYL